MRETLAEPRLKLAFFVHSTIFIFNLQVMSTPRNKKTPARNRKTKADLEKEIIALKKQLGNINQPIDNEPDNISVSKSSFRIDLYDSGEEPLQGKIEYTLTKEKKAFKGLDASVITSFILNHLPAKEKEKLQKEEKTTKTNPSISSTALPQVKAMEAIPEDYPQSSKLVSQDQAFTIRMVLDTSSIPAKKTTTPHQVLIYAKRLESGMKQIVGGTSHTFSPVEDLVSIGISPQKLTPGTYRLEAAMSTSASEAIDTFTPLEGSSIIQVY